MIAGSTSFRTSLARRKYLDTYFRWKYFLEITWEVLQYCINLEELPRKAHLACSQTSGHEGSPFIAAESRPNTPVRPARGILPRSINP